MLRAKIFVDLPSHGNQSNTAKQTLNVIDNLATGLLFDQNVRKGKYAFGAEILQSAHKMNYNTAYRRGYRDAVRFLTRQIDA